VKPPIDGMKTSPYGPDAMVGAWWGCVLFAVSEAELRARFQKDTGHDINKVLSAGGLDALIEQSTGHGREVVVAFCDWVTIKLWGQESDEDENEKT